MTTTLRHLPAALLVLSAALAQAVASDPAPTVLSTDIGSDIDDTWALAQIIRSPELDLKMVLTETGESAYRGQVTAKFLEAAGRTDVTVALGIDGGAMEDTDRHQGPWVKDYDLAGYPGTIAKDGVQAFIDLVKASDQPVTVIAIGPAPSLAAALRQAPEIAANCRMYGMFGSFDIGYGASPEAVAENNVRVDPDAARTLFAADWKAVAITPLDTCGTSDLSGDDYHAVWSATGDPVCRAVIENYCIWAPRVPWMDCSFFATASSTLFDSVAVYMAYSDAYLAYEKVTFRVTDDGFTVREPDGPYTMNVALRWKDLPAFKRHLSQRLLGAE